jgi:dodecin
MPSGVRSREPERRDHTQPGGGPASSIVKVVGVNAQPEKSFDHAAEEALNEAARTSDNIKKIQVSGRKAIVEDNKIAEYCVNTAISFVVEGHD